MKDVSPHSELSDSELICIVLTGSEDAFACLVDRHYSRLLTVIYRLADSREQAEDVVQESWLKAYARLSELNDVQAFRGWLYRIARNELISRQRHRSVIRMESLSRFGHPFPVPTSLVRHSSRIISYGESDLIARVLASLDPDDHEILVLCAEGFRNAEIAAILGISSAAAQSRVYRAKRRFRIQYEALNHVVNTVLTSERANYG